MAYDKKFLDLQRTRISFRDSNLLLRVKHWPRVKIFICGTTVTHISTTYRLDVTGKLPANYLRNLQF